MKQPEVRAKDLIAEMNAKFPHLKMRLGTAEDLKHSGMMVHFFPQSIRSGKGAPIDKANRDDQKKCRVRRHGKK